MKRIFTFLFLFVFIVATAFAQEFEKQNVDRNGNPTFVKFDTKIKSVSKSETKAVLSGLFNMTKNDEYKTMRSEKDQIGYTHDRFQQYYKGIKVEHGVYVVHSRNEVIESLSGEYKVINDINVTPTVSSAKALENAKAFINAQKYMPEDKASTPELVIVKSSFGKHLKDVHEMVLAYKVDIYATQPLSRDYVYVSAHTGEIVHVNAILVTAVETGSADTRYSGTKSITTDSYGGSYRLRDYSRGNGIITYNCNEGTSYTSAVDFTDANNSWTAAEYDNADKDNGALDAHWAGMVTYDYFKNIHGRNSFDGNNALIKTYVHFDVNYDNAYWNGSVLTFGDGTDFDILTSLDVFGHEFGHAVCSYTADLAYENESGALNEAFSDIWGCVIEYYNAPEKDTWLMGEDLGTALRSLSDPKSKGLPDTYMGDNWYPLAASPTRYNDYGGVHYNNGPYCHWFYLISEGGSGTNDNSDAYSVTAIGIEKAEKIAYRVESVYMTSSSDYADARTYSIQAAQDLYGVDSQEEISVTNAMYAVGVGDAYGGTTPPVSATYCESEGTNFSYEWIAKVELGSFTKTSAGAAYSDFTSSTINVNAGATYAVTLTPGFASTTYDEYWKIWIDYDNDTIFDANELAYDAGALSSSAVSGNITIQSGISGVRRMRVSMKYDGAQTACETFGYGEVEDYNVTIGSGTPDTQAPTVPTGLAYSNLTTSSATISWNASTDNVGVTAYDLYKNGSFLASTANLSYNVTGLAESTSYSFYVKAKDAANNISAASSTLYVTTLEESTSEYCASQGNSVVDEWIDLVQLNEIDNVTGANGGYADFTNLTANVARGSSQRLYVSCDHSGTAYTEYWHAWIDWDHSGTFDTDERMLYGSSTSEGLLYEDFTVPSDAVLGTTGMRVTMKYNSAATSCETFSYGEVEDYTVNVTSASFSAFVAENNSNAEILGNEPSTDVVVYPSPASSYINVNVVNGTKHGIINIYNMIGSIVKVVAIDGNEQEIDISDLPTGVYIISVEDEKEPIIKQFIKK